jgi:hypothetical protein
MKRIILSMIVMAFAAAVQAGDGGCCQDKEKAGCSDGKVKTSLNSTAGQASDKAEGGCCANKTKVSLEAKGGCPFAAASCGMQTQAKKTAVKQVVLMSPKAASLASN